MIMHQQFKDYDGKLPTLKGFVDDSWGNDVCPSLYNPERKMKLWVDYVNPAKRECGGLRYTLCIYSELNDELTPILSSELLTHIEDFLK